MHLGPRCLQLLRTATQILFLGCSVLLGCAIAIPLTKVYLKTEMSLLKEAHPEVAQSVFIDDVGQDTYGDGPEVQKRLMAAGIAFIRLSRKLSLRISSKSTIVASSLRLRKALKMPLCN